MSIQSKTAKAFFFLKIVLLAVAYYLISDLWLRIYYVTSVGNFFWPLTGLALAGILLFGQKYWPAILIGSLLLSLNAGYPILASFILSSGKALEALLAVYMLKRAEVTLPLRRLRDVLSFIFLASLVSTFVCSVFFVFGLWVANLLDTSEFIETISGFWVRNFLGDIIIAPLFLVWDFKKTSKFNLSFRKILDILLCAVVLVMICLLAFDYPIKLDLKSEILPYLIFPVSILAGVKFGMHGSVITTFLVSLIVITAVGSDQSLLRWLIGYGLSFMQFFIGNVAATSLILAAALTERKRSEGLALESEQRYRKLASEQYFLAEDNARLYREAQDINRMKDEFLAMLSHELRSPLNVIVGWSELLINHEVPNIDPVLEIIHRNAKTQTQMVTDLLDVSRVITGKLSFEIYPIDILPVLHKTVEGLRLIARNKNIDLQVNFEMNESSIFVLGDASRLQQVFANIITNAIKFMHRAGIIRIEMQVDDAKVHFEIIDQGEGIDPLFLPYVFDNFRQEDTKITRKHGGLGLGLAIAHSIVEFHNGTLRAESEGKNKGAKFILSFPLLKTSTSFPLSNFAFHEQKFFEDNFQLKSSDLRGISILAVDDDEEMLGLLETIFENNGATIKTAISAAQAMEILTTYTPDILLSDIGMPEEDGYQLIRKIRKMPPPYSQIPAIALTAFTKEEEQEKALRCGFQAHIAKPFVIKKLIYFVTSLAKRNPKILEKL